jgi:O-antigen ligase
VFCIAVSIPITISRSGIISASLALVVLLVSMPPVRRLTVIAAIPVVLGAIFIAAHRLLGTIATYFTLGTSDDSIAHRVNNFPYAVHLISQAPWFGVGGGTYVAAATQNLGETHILDDEYLDAGIELGVVGLVLLTFFLFWPIVAAMSARRFAGSSQLRELSGALAGGALSGLVCSATFDSFGFPMFVMVESLIIGLCGAVWLLVHRRTEGTEADSRTRDLAMQLLTAGVWNYQLTQYEISTPER